MSNKKSGNQQGSSDRQPGNNRNRRNGRGREDYDYDSRDRDWQSSSRYDRDDDSPFYGNRSADFGDDFGSPRSNYDWRHDEGRYERDEQENRRSGYYPGSVEGNRRESRGEGYQGYGRQGRDDRPGIYDEEDRFYRDRGYGRDMYARNDRSDRWEDDRRRYEEGYGGGGYPYSGRYDNDRRNNRPDYENRYGGGNEFSRQGHRYDDDYDERPGDRYANDEWRGQQRQTGSEQRQGRRRVVGRGMYGNNPSSRYGSYGGDTMHGNMGGGTWQGNNEYQVGGGAGYQPSDAGTYGSMAGAPEHWDEDRAPGRKTAATKNQGGTAAKNKTSRDSKDSNKLQTNRGAGNKSSANKKGKRTLL